MSYTERARPFLMVKPDGGRYLAELEQTLLESRLRISEVFYVSDWEPVARALYEPQLQSCDRAFYVAFEAHVWLNRYLFGNRALVLILETLDNEQDLDTLARAVHQARDHFRSTVAESRNGTFIVAINLDRLPGEAYQGAGRVGVLGVQASETSFTPLIECVGRWDDYYFKYVHSPDGSATSLTREWEVLVRLSVIAPDNRISLHEWKLLKFLRCMIPPSEYVGRESMQRFLMNSPRMWAEIYAREIEMAGGYEEYLRIKVQEKKPLLQRIVRYTRPHGRILEAGCGTGVLSSYLSNCGFRAIAIDIDEEMLEIARRISENCSCRPTFERRNLFALDYPPDFFDVVFSHGVLEHFSDEDIITILNTELYISQTVIISIPSNYFREEDRMFGDERFLSCARWERLISQTPSRIIEKFGFHFQSGWQRLWSSLLRRKPFGSTPYLAFVLQKKSDVVAGTKWVFK